MKARTKRRIKHLWNKRSRRDCGGETCRNTIKLIGRQIGGQWVQKRTTSGGLVFY